MYDALVRIHVRATRPYTSTSSSPGRKEDANGRDTYRYSTELDPVAGIRIRDGKRSLPNVRWKVRTYRTYRHFGQTYSFFAQFEVCIEVNAGRKVTGAQNRYIAEV